MMLKTRGSSPYLTAACDKERENSQRNRKKKEKKEISRELHVLYHFWSISCCSDFSSTKEKRRKTTRNITSKHSLLTNVVSTPNKRGLRVRLKTSSPLRIYSQSTPSQVDPRHGQAVLPWITLPRALRWCLWGGQNLKIFVPVPNQRKPHSKSNGPPLR